MNRLCLPIALMLLLPGLAGAQTVTVAKSGTPNFNTVQAAIASFTPDPNPSQDNVIQITDASVYDEAITIDVSLTLEGTGSSRPVLAVQTNPVGDGNDGLNINGTALTVVLRNLIIIPSRTATPADDGIRITGTSSDVNLTIDNVLVTANNGADAPVSIDGLTPVDLTGATTFGDDGMFLSGTNSVVSMVDTVVTHNQALQGGTTAGDGLVCSGVALSYNLGDGCVFSYNGRLGIQGNGSFRINAPTDRVLVIGNGTKTGAFAGIWFAGVGAGASPERVLDGVNVLNNTDPADTAQGWGIEQQNGGDIPFTLRNAIVAGNQAQGLLVGSVGTAGLITIEDVTFADNGSAEIQTDPAHTGNITITDTIIAGNGTSNATNVVQHNGTGVINISNSALVTAGSNRLTTPPIAGTGTVNQTAVINDAVNFLDTNDPTSPNFFDVIVFTGDNSPYRTAGTGGTPLTGGAGLFEFGVTGVREWRFYR